MKNLILVLAVMFTSAISFAGNDNPTVQKSNDPLINKAVAAIKSACPNANGQLNYSTKTVSSCFAGGFITEVNFWKSSKCPGNKPCIQTVEVVGTVTLDCEGNVISVNCGAGSEI